MEYIFGRSTCCFIIFDVKRIHFRESAEWYGLVIGANIVDDGLVGEIKVVHTIGEVYIAVDDITFRSFHHTFIFVV